LITHEATKLDDTLTDASSHFIRDIVEGDHVHGRPPIDDVGKATCIFYSEGVVDRSRWCGGSSVVVVVVDDDGVVKRMDA